MQDISDIAGLMGSGAKEIESRIAYLGLDAHTHLSLDQQHVQFASQRSNFVDKFFDQLLKILNEHSNYYPTRRI